MVVEGLVIQVGGKACYVGFVRFVSITLLGLIIACSVAYGCILLYIMLHIVAYYCILCCISLDIFCLSLFYLRNLIPKSVYVCRKL